MLAQEFSPALFIAMAVCGGGNESPYGDTTVTSPDGWTCFEIQRMVEADLWVARECDVDAECDQVIPDTGACPTNDLVINIAHDAEFLFEMFAEAEAIDCDLSFMTSGYCPESAEPGCSYGKCGWEF